MDGLTVGVQGNKCPFFLVEQGYSLLYNTEILCVLPSVHLSVTGQHGAKCGRLNWASGFSVHVKISNFIIIISTTQVHDACVTQMAHS